MSLNVGIIGLPNVGKSTIFNVLTKAQNAECANYPFCTIDSNKAIVPVPDQRVDKLAELVDPENTAYATVEFIDIAGLVKGASHGAGLGNQFLGHIREVDALLHVIRCFDDENVAHVETELDPVRDIQIVNTELILADLQSLDKKIASLEKNVRNDKALQPLLEIAHDFSKWLDSGRPLATHADAQTETAVQLRREVHFLTDKPVIYCANVDEEELTSENSLVDVVTSYAAENHAECVTIYGQFEAELLDLDPQEQQDFLKSYALAESGLNRIVHTAFKALRLQSFFTAQPAEVRAWTFRAGCTAPQAAGLIHSDFENGFIRAKVVSFEDFVKYGSLAAARKAGAMRTEGKDYEVQDGDVIEFQI